MGLIAELKRRNVLRMAGLYLVGAWLIVQVTGTLLPMFEAPAWVARTIVILLAVGFVPALVISWIFEITPEGIKRDAELDPAAANAPQAARRMNHALVVVLALALAYFGFDKFVLGPRREAALLAGAAQAPAANAPSPAPHAANSKSIAVLPFENLSDEKANAYFASGIQDLILTRLSEIAELTVSSRTSTEKYRSRPDDLRAVGAQLGVATILEGSVQKAGDQVLINVQLIDAATDKHLWAQSYTRTLDNIFGVEGEVAQTIADALKAKLSPVEAEAVAKPPTTNKQAYDLFLRGVYLLNSYNRTLNRAELEQSAELARQTTEIDPNFIDAYLWLALAYSKLGDHPVEQEAAVRRALALDPNSSNAHRQLAYLLSHKGEHQAAIVEAEEARRLAPGKNTSFLAMANTLGKAGRIDEAAQAMRDLVKLQPNENFYRVWLAMLEEQRRHYVEARDTLQPAVARDPADISAAAQLAETHILGFGDLGAARATLKSVLTPVSASAPLALSWYRVEMLSRDPAAAQAAIAAAPAAGFTVAMPPPELLQADALRASGNTEQARKHYAAALAALRQAIAARAGDANVHDQLALALVGLGQNQDAIAAASKAVELESVALSAEFGPAHLANLAQIYAQTGHAQEAVELLRKLLDMPAGNVMSVHLLQLDPVWDPIRKDPRFEALLK